MQIQGKVAVVTGAGSGIGRAVALELARRGAGAVVLADRSDAVRNLAGTVEAEQATHAEAFVGDVTDAAFRSEVFERVVRRYGIPRICVPAAGITRDRLAARIDKETGRADLYPIDAFRQVLEVNLVAPVYWALEMVGRIAQERSARGLKKWEPEEHVQGTIVFIGSVSSQGNKGQIAYAATKAALQGAAATLTKEAIYYGVRCGVVHPGFTDTPMVHALGEDFIRERILPSTQLGRLIKPEEIADAVCFMISNSAVSGELWTDAGWHPPA
ncbi:MAG: SDR family NAD(P)-dependent oxidoreductase [Pirellulales bacterium]|nr:SDR family NAD(P)-dependent oxidoreductase [Pirellulales bacterium]